jgi:hypothetical protein
VRYITPHSAGRCYCQHRRSHWSKVSPLSRPLQRRPRGHFASHVRGSYASSGLARDVFSETPHAPPAQARVHSTPERPASTLQCAANCTRNVCRPSLSSRNSPKARRQGAPGAVPPRNRQPGRPAERLGDQASLCKIRRLHGHSRNCAAQSFPQDSTTSYRPERSWLINHTAGYSRLEPLPRDDACNEVCGDCPYSASHRHGFDFRHRDGQISVLGRATTGCQHAGRAPAAYLS